MKKFIAFISLLFSLALFLQAQEQQKIVITYNANGDLLTAYKNGLIEISGPDSGSKPSSFKAGAPLNDAVWGPENTIAAASEDNTVKVFSDQGRLIQSLDGTDLGTPLSLALSPARVLAVGYDTGAILLFEYDAGKKEFKTPRYLGGHDQAVIKLNFDSGGERLLTIPQQENPKVFSTKERTVAGIAAGNTAAISSGCFAGDNIILTRLDGFVLQHNLPTRNTATIWESKELQPISSKINPEGTIIAVGLNNGDVIHFALQDYTELSGPRPVTEPHLKRLNPVTSITWNPLKTYEMASMADDNRTVIYDSRYGTLKVIYPAYYVSQVYVNDQEKPVNAYTGQALLYLPPGELEIRAPEGFKVDGPSRISLATNQTITTTLKKVQGTEYSVLTEDTIPVEIRNADNFLAVKSNGTIRIFDIDEKKLVSSPINTDPAAFDINAAGLLATIGSDGVKRGYTPDGELIWQTTGRLAGNEPVCLAFRADGIRFAAAGGRRLQFIESQTGKLIWERRLDYTIQALDVREDIVIAAAERMVYSFSTADGTLMPSAIPIQPAEIHSIQLTPRQVFAATSQGMVFLGNSTGRIIQTIPGETSRARLSPAGRYVAGLTTRGVELQDMETETRRKTTIEGGISGFSLSDKNLILFDAALKEGGAAVRFFRLGSRIEEYQRLYIFSDDTWVIGPVPMDGSYSHSEGGENHVKTVTKN